VNEIINRKRKILKEEKKKKIKKNKIKEKEYIELNSKNNSWKGIKKENLKEKFPIMETVMQAWKKRKMIVYDQKILKKEKNGEIPKHHNIKNSIKDWYSKMGHFAMYVKRYKNEKYEKTEWYFEQSIIMDFMEYMNEKLLKAPATIKNHLIAIQLFLKQCLIIEDFEMNEKKIEGTLNTLRITISSLDTRIKQERSLKTNDKNLIKSGKIIESEEMELVFISLLKDIKIFIDKKLKEEDFKNIQDFKKEIINYEKKLIVLTFFIFCGPRLGFVTRMIVSNFEYDEKEKIFVYKSFKEKVTRANSKIPMFSYYGNILKDWIENWRPKLLSNDFKRDGIWIGYYGNCYDGETIYKIVKNEFKNILTDKNITPLVIRGHFITMAISKKLKKEGGTNLEFLYDVSKYLNTSIKMMMENYHKRDALEEQLETAKFLSESSFIKNEKIENIINSIENSIKKEIIIKEKENIQDKINQKIEEIQDKNYESLKFNNNNYSFEKYIELINMKILEKKIQLMDDNEMIFYYYNENEKIFFWKTDEKIFEKLIINIPKEYQLKIIIFFKNNGNIV
jgi:hypothetical protein